MKEVKEEKKVSENKIQQLCAIPKDVAIEKINELIEANPQVFKEYFLWVSVVNSHVSVIGDPNQKD